MSDNESNHLENEVVSDDDHTIDDETLDEIETECQTTTVGTIYSNYLENDILEIRPEYQREFCWSFDRQKLFLDTIMINYVSPSIVLYKKINKKNKRLPADDKFIYECIDGQHRLATIKQFIEGTGSRLLYILDRTTKERMVYHDIKQSSSKNVIKYRTMTEVEKDKFRSYIIPCIVVKSYLDINQKCEMFNRLQNGERVNSYVKTRNTNHPIFSWIRENRMIDKYKQLLPNLNITRSHNGKAVTYSKLLWIIVRTLFIFDRKNLMTNYLDLNLEKYIKTNSPNGRLHCEIAELDKYFPDFIKIMTETKWSSKIVVYFYYLIACYYVNHTVDITLNLIKNITNNITIYYKYNNMDIYSAEGKVVSSSKMTEMYKSLISENF